MSAGQCFILYVIGGEIFSQHEVIKYDIMEYMINIYLTTHVSASTLLSTIYFFFNESIKIRILDLDIVYNSNFTFYQSTFFIIYT